MRTPGWEQHDPLVWEGISGISIVFHLKNKDKINKALLILSIRIGSGALAQPVCQMATCHVQCLRLPGCGVVHNAEGWQWCPHSFAAFRDVAMCCNQPVPPEVDLWIILSSGN